MASRWAVQADYFAWRITANDLTGITGPEENDRASKTPAEHFSAVGHGHVNMPRRRDFLLPYLVGLTDIRASGTLVKLLSSVD